MLLCFPEFLDSDPSTEALVHQTVDFMLGLQQPNGNIAPAMDEVSGRMVRPPDEELVHWCHGGPGNTGISYHFKVAIYSVFA